MSLLGKYSCENITAPTYLSFTTAAGSALISIVASVGNILVVLAVFLNPNKDLRSPFNYLIANLSFADLVVGLVLAPFSTVYHILEGLEMLMDWFKHMTAIVYFVTCTASLVSLTAVALDRYVAITYPLIYRTKLNPNRPVLASLMVWIVSISLSMIYLAVGYNRFRFIFATTAVATTFVVLIVTNSKIFSYLRNQIIQWDSMHDKSKENMAKKQAIIREKRITKTLVIVLLLFLACYLPSYICIYIINFCIDCDCQFIHWARDIQFLLAMANSAVNPFVYAWRFDNFRKAFKSILTCQKGLRRVQCTSINSQLSKVTTDATNGQDNPVEISSREIIANII